MTKPPTRADHLRAAEEAERLGDFALAGQLKTLALNTKALTTEAEPVDVDELRAQIAEAEDAKDFATAGRLKTQLLDAHRSARK
jgi:hypothetical protein